MGRPRSESRIPSIPALLVPLAFGGGIAGLVLASGLSRGAGLGLRTTLMLAEAALAFPALAAAVAMAVPFGDGLGLKPVSSKTVAMSLACGAGLWVLSLGILELQYTLWRPPASFIENMRLLHQALRPKDPLDGLLSVLAIAIAPAVFEELAFRGVYFPALTGSLGLGGAVLVSAILFGFIHIDEQVFYRAPFAIAVGVFLALLRFRTTSLVPPILTHATLNTITFLVAPLVDNPSEIYPEPHPLFGLAAFAGGLTVCVLLFRLVSARPAAPDDSPIAPS